MTHFDTLGVPTNCPTDVAKAAYRRLASLYHPDKVTDEAEKKKVETKFKAVKEAWEAIESGYTVEKSTFNVPPKAAPKSSFTQGPARPQQPHAGKPAPGYEARRTAPVLPHTYYKSAGGRYGSREHMVDLEITEDQSFEGCTVPFWHDGTVRDYVVRPGTSSRVERMQYPLDAMIGRSVGTITIEINLKVLQKQSAPEEKTRDAEMELPLCALGIFTGGRVSVLDHLGEKVTITIPPGYNPSEPFKIDGHGYGSLTRGALIVKIIPVFKTPTNLNQHERAQLQRLNEMART
jgi:hypothetical protein